MLKPAIFTLALIFACGDASRAAEAAPTRGHAPLAAWASSFAVGDTMPPLDAGAGCATDDKAQREWSELLMRRVEVELNNAYRDEVAREPIAPALEVRAFVNDVEMQVCQARAGAWQGGFRVQVTWTIQEPGTDRVLYQGSTAGSYASAIEQRGPTSEGLRRAMSLAVQNLLTDRRFRTVMRANAERVQARVAAAD